MIKLGQASTWAAVSVGLAPYALLAALYAVFIIGYAPAVICYLYFAQNKQEAADELITTTACVIVALVTLTPPSGRVSKPYLAAKSGDSPETQNNYRI